MIDHNISMPINMSLDKFKRIEILNFKSIILSNWNEDVSTTL